MRDGSRLEGRTAIVTGAGSGLGEATAVEIARAGGDVACVDISARAAEATCSRINGMGRRAIAVACDVSDAAAVDHAVGRAARELGGPDVVVNAAGVDHTVAIGELRVEQWDQVIGVNLRGPFLFAKAALPLMRARGGGHIVNIASTGALRTWEKAAPYHASKAGLVAFSRALSLEARPLGVRVTTVVPGGMRTHFFDRFAGTDIPMPDPARLQDPATVAAAIVFALTMPEGSVLQEMTVTPPLEPSWP